MIRALPRISAIVLACGAIATSPAATAPDAAAVKSPIPASPAPVAMPYPNAAPSIEVMALSWRASGARQPQVMTSDPQEGGEIARAKSRKNPGVSISEMTVSKRTDTSSPKIMSVSSDAGTAEPGKLEYPNMQANGGGGGPPPAGTATITVARGHCASGQHFPTVKLTMRGKSHTLQDVDVLSCTTVDANTDSCTLRYGSVSG